MQVWKNAVPLRPVISFSVINYVVSMRCLTRVTQLIFFVPYRAGLSTKCVVLVDALGIFVVMSTKMALFVETSIISLNIFRKVTTDRMYTLISNWG